MVNVDHEPSDNQKWYHETKAAAKEKLEIPDASDASLQACILGICEDRGLDAHFVMGSNDEQEQLSGIG